MTMSSVAVPVEVRTMLSAVDRCDRCQARAVVRVVMLSSVLPLLFCAHHYVGNAAALADIAVVTHDERELP